MYGLSGLFPYHLILADDERNAKEIYEDYRFYDKNVYFYPAKDLLFFQADIHGNLLIRQRMRDPGTSGTGRSDGGYQHRRMHGFSDAPGKDQKQSSSF